LFENLVIHVADGAEQSVLYGIDQATGQIVWRVPRASSGSWCSPVLMNAGTADAPQWQVIVNGTGADSGSPGVVIAYDPRNGEEIWRARGTTDIPCPTAIVGENMIVSATGGNGPVFALRPNGQGDVTDSHVSWRSASGGPYVPTGLIYRDRLYLVSDNGLLTCQNVADGELVWRKRLQGAFSASLLAGGGNVYATSERGDIYVFHAGDKFELVATNRLHEPCLATPAAAHGELYVRSERHLYCVGEAPLLASDSPLPAAQSPAIRSPGDIISPSSEILSTEKP
jgi:outer membrane protein assembly factor BamB